MATHQALQNVAEIAFPDHACTNWAALSWASLVAWPDRAVCDVADTLYDADYAAAGNDSVFDGAFFIRAERTKGAEVICRLMIFHGIMAPMLSEPGNKKARLRS